MKVILLYKWQQEKVQTDYLTMKNNKDTYGEESVPDTLSPEFLFSSLESEIKLHFSVNTQIKATL